MNILKANGIDKQYVKVLEYAPNILINYELVPTTSQIMRTIDRGMQSDSYSCEFIFRGDKIYIQNIVETFADLRDARLPIIMSELEEPFFGFNVLSTGSLTGVVLEMGKVITPMKNVQEMSVKIVLDTSTLTFIGSPIIPATMRCLGNKWEGYNEWKAMVNQTYYRSLYFVDHERGADKFVFTGTYSMNNTDLTNILAFHKSIRGQLFTIQEPNWGTTHMFGYDTTDTEHDVMIDSLTYERISAIRKLVTINLIKVG